MTDLFPWTALQLLWTAVLQPKLQAFWTRFGGLFSGAVTLLTFVVACVTLWPTLYGAHDARTATLLAEWTAKKDFFELCETHNWELPSCDEAKSNPPGPPPVLDPRRPEDEIAEPPSTVSVLFALAAMGALAVTFLISVLAVSLKNLSRSHWNVLTVIASGFFTTSYIVASADAVMPALAYVYPDWTSQRSATANITTLFGTLVGMILFGYMADLYGRRSIYGLELVIVVIATVGFAMSTAGYGDSMSISGWIIFWRFLIGLSLGAEYPLAAVVLAEWSSTRSRAKILAAAYVMHTIGKLSARTVSFVLLDMVGRQWQIAQDETDFSIVAPAIDSYWRLVIGIGSLPAVISIALRLRLPETPRWLMASRKKMSDAAARQTARLYANGEVPSRGISERLSGMALYLFESDNRKLRALLGVMTVWFAVDVASEALGLEDLRRRSIIWPSLRASYDVGQNYEHIRSRDASRQTDTVSKLLKQYALRNLVDITIPAVAGSLIFLLFIDYVPRVAWLRYWFLALVGVFLISGTIFAAGLGFDTHAVMLMLYSLAQVMFNLGPYTIRFILPAELFDTEYRATFYAVASSAGKVGAIAIQVLSNSSDQNGNQAQFAILLFSLCPALLLGAIVTWKWIPEVQYKRGHSATERDNAYEETGNGPSRTFFDSLIIPNRSLEEIATGSESLNSTNYELRERAALLRILDE